MGRSPNPFVFTHETLSLIHPQSARFSGFDTRHVLCAACRNDDAARRVVCLAGKTGMESTIMDIRPRLVGALPDDGNRGLVDLETRWLASADAALLHSTHSQRRMVSDLFWRTKTKLGIGGHRGFVDRRSTDTLELFPHQ